VGEPLALSPIPAPAARLRHAQLSREIELDNWTGHRFTDLLSLLKTDGEWKIMNKVFHLHP
jgi:hypothetical protein